MTKSLPEKSLKSNSLRQEPRPEDPMIKRLAFFEDREPKSKDFLSDVMEGLSSKPRELSPKYLYDAEGARLFEEICETEEYYLTRTEIALLKSCAEEAAFHAGSHATIIEFGSGAFVKIRELLKQFQDPYGLVAIDISREQLLENAASLCSDFPSLKVGAICADFMKPIPIPSMGANKGRAIGFLPGSTIGNFTPPMSVMLLQSIRQTIGEKGALLIGVDLKKRQGAFGSRL